MQYETQREAIEATHSDADDFKNQWGLTTIRAAQAYAHLELEHGLDTAPGTGQTVGLIDTGIDTGHPVFAGKIVTEHFFSGATDETGSRRSHGTAVASVIAARPSASFTQNVTAARGVAWGADVAMFAVSAGQRVGNYAPISLAGLSSADNSWSSEINYVINWSNGGRTLDFVNLSVGFLGIINQYSAQDLRTNFGNAISALAQSGATEKTVFIWAAGNAHRDPCDPNDFVNNSDLCVEFIENNISMHRVDAKSVQVLPGLPARIDELRGHVIAVVGIAANGEIAGFSNRCGIAADWCLAAPGAGIRLAYFGPDPDDSSPGARGAYTGNGTSFAAPMVAGGLVLMKHRFRDQLSNTALLSRLLATADKSGIYADSTVYGQGLMDLGAATEPVGGTTISLGDTVRAAGIDITRTRLELGDAFGDGPTRALDGREIVAFDELGAPFWYELASFTGAARGRPLTARLSGFLKRPQGERGSALWRPAFGVVETDRSSASGLRLGRLDASAEGAGGHLSLAGRALALSAVGEGGLAAHAFSTEGLDGELPAAGAVLSWRPEGSVLGLRGGLVSERETVLGSQAAGAFGRVAAVSLFAGIEARARFDGWQLVADAEVGTANVSVRDGLIAALSPLTTSAFALRATRPLADEGALMLSLSQPLRVEAGRALLSVPVGRTKEGLVRRHSVAADVTPTGRQIELEARWQRRLAGAGELSLSAAWSRHPGHAAAAAPQLTILAGWHYTF